jgi:hypothetical protein
MSARTRWIAVGLALLGACALAIAVQGGRWWSVGDGLAIGPTGTKACFAGECGRHGLDWIGGSELWRRAAIATTAATLIAAFALIALAGSLAARRRGALAAGATLTATLTAAVAGVVFVATFPGTSALATGQPASLDRGALLYLFGVIVSVAVSVVVIRQRPAGPAA